jgi:HEPN domain-containing protein
MASESDLAAQLLRRASEDEAAARAMLPVPSVTDAIVGFHAQQAVEKSLKAVLAARRVEFPFIHDIAGLAELCEQSGGLLPQELAGVDALTPYAAILRYDDSPAGAVDTQAALQWAASAVSWARSVLESVEDRDA